MLQEVTSHFTQSRKKAFTLIELLIVIAIMAAIGVFAFSKVAAAQKAKIANNVQKIKDVFNDDDGDAQLVCLENSTKCFILTNGASIKRELSNPIGQIEMYVLDDSNNPQKPDLGRFKDTPISLRMRHFRNGSTSQLIIQNKEFYYFIPSYFGEIKKFDSMNDAVSMWTKYDELAQEGGYYR